MHILQTLSSSTEHFADVHAFVTFLHNLPTCASLSFSLSKGTGAQAQFTHFPAFTSARWCIHKVWTTQRMGPRACLLSGYFNGMAASGSESPMKTMALSLKEYELEAESLAKPLKPLAIEFPVASKRRQQFCFNCGNSQSSPERHYQNPQPWTASPWW